MDDLYVSLDFTPNPKTLKYVVNREINPGGAVFFKTKEEASKGSELAAHLLSISHIESIMVGKTFISVTLDDEEHALAVNAIVPEVIQKFLETGKSVIAQGYTQERGGDSSDSATVQQILKVIEEEVRPAVAMDGGDITFDRYEDGILYLQMKGACSGCPSSTLTLKDGIENRIRQFVPDLKEVVSV